MSIWDNYFVFDGVDSRTFGAIAFFNDVDSSPIKEYTTSVIPGRSGDFLLNDRRFANIAQVYDVVIPTNFETNYANLRAFLLSRDGYCRLEDTSHPDEFYQAYFSEQIKPRVSRDRDIGRFQITFTRKPQRWLKSGEEEIALGINTSTQYITNPTQFPTYPLIKIHLSSTPSFAINLAGVAIQTLTNTVLANKYVNIDLETLQTYGGSSATSTNSYYNQYIQYTANTTYGSKMFMLSPGRNTIGKPSAFTNLASASVIPRWYTI